MFRAATSCATSQLARKLTRNSYPKKLIYTDSNLGLTSVHATQEEELLQLQERQNLMNLKSRIISSAEKGLLLSTDLDNISLMAIDKDDLAPGPQGLYVKRRKSNQQILPTLSPNECC